MFRNLAGIASVLLPVAAGASLNLSTDGTTPWTVSVPSLKIQDAPSVAGYIKSTPSITPFQGGGRYCAALPCAFDGFWTATLTFNIPAGATGVTLKFSGIVADDRAVLVLNNTAIGNAHDGSSPAPAGGNMTLTYNGPNQFYEFGGSSTEAGTITGGFFNGANTLTLIVNNTESGASGTLTGVGFTVAGVTATLNYTPPPPAVSIAGISNAASYTSGAVAPGEAVLIAGSGIGPANLTGAALDAKGNISTNVAQTQFLFNGVPAPIVYVSSQYSSVIVPYEVAGTTSAQVVAMYNGNASAPFTVPVVAAAPGIFSANASGTGPGAILNADLSRNSAQNPAPRGSTIVLFVTGEGQTRPGGLDGAITESLIAPALAVTVSFGGVTADSYAFIGETPGVVAGVLQINVTIPQASPTGTVAVAVTVGTTSSQAGLTINIQ